MLVYAIICMDRKTLEMTISGECYDDYHKAIDFIKSRSGNPVKSDFCKFRYVTKDIIYLIKPLDVK